MPSPHCRHIPSIGIPLLIKLAVTRKQLLQAFQRKCGTFPLMFKPHIFPHSLLSSSLLLLEPSSPLILSFFSFASLYSDLTENCPEGVCFHMSLSCIPKELTGIFIISNISPSSKRDRNSSLFQPSPSRFKSSLTFSKVHPSGFAGLGLVRLLFGSQSSSQIFIEQPFPTCHLLPSLIS